MRVHGRKCRLSPRDWRGPAKSINENGAIHSPDGFSFWNSIIRCDRRNIDMHSYRSYLAAAAAMAGLANAPLDAHAVWFAQRAKKVALIYGVGADDLDTVQRFSFIEKMTGYDAAYREFKVDPRIAGPMVLVDTEKQPTLLTVVFFNGIWSKVDGEFVAKGRDQAPTSTLSEKNYKYSVAIMGPLERPIPALPDQLLQIVPVGAIPASHGANLTYRVLYKGKPVAGASVINDLVNDPDQAPRMTKAGGTVTFPVRNQGLNVIEAVYNAPTDDPKRYDRIENSATLTFTLPHKPE
jgi:nickel transport protein